MPTTKRVPLLSVRKEGTVAKIEILDDIGPSWLGMIDERSVADGLAKLGSVSEIEVRLNSLGGASHEGVGIYNLLKNHPAKVRVRIDGIAASAASLVAMAGDEVIMPAGALLMIHEPWSFAMGDADEMLRMAGLLEKVIQSALEIYVAKSGQSDEQLRAWLAAETWFTGEEAVEAGLADSLGGEVKMSVELCERSFRNAPQQYQQLIALSAKGAIMPPKKPANPPADDPTPVTSQSVDPQPANDPPAAPPAADPRAEFATQLAKYTTTFGANEGSQYLAAGKSFEEACIEFINLRGEQLTTKDTEIAELNAKLASLDTGEVEPATFGSGDPADEPNKELETKLGSSGLARFAAGITLPAKAK